MNENYHENEAPCPATLDRDHRWSTMGHPLGHRCIKCHVLKWIHNDPLQRGTKSVRDGLIPRVY